MAGLRYMARKDTGALQTIGLNSFFEDKMTVYSTYCYPDAQYDPSVSIYCMLRTSSLGEMQQ